MIKALVFRRLAPALLTAAALGMAAPLVASLGGLPAGSVAQAQPVASFADLAERLSPAVVNISTSTKIPEPQSAPDIPKGSPLEDLFKNFFDHGKNPPPRAVQSLGSGFVISPEGYVVTNNHVITDADEITVNFADGASLTAKLVGTDPKTDIALLKVEPEKPLAFVGFGDSDALRVGDWVLAIGNPFGLGGSVSAGIVSARNRDINSGPYDDYIQTDAAINRGNSGGPLFNMDGKVVGVNSAIISPTGGSVGIGFAVPSNIVKRVVDQLREYGMTKRGWLGVRIQTVTPEIADAMQMPKPEGALVTSVDDGGPAAKGGIEAGDVILKFDGKDVTHMRDLPRMVAETPVDKVVRVVVFRKGKTQTLKVTIALLKETPPEAQAGAKPGAAPGAESELTGTGLKLSELTPEGRKKYNVADDVNGVLVTSVDQGSAAFDKGLRPGDVIVEVGQKPVSKPAEVQAGVDDARSAGRGSVLLLIQNGGDVRFVPLPVGSK